MCYIYSIPVQIKKQTGKEKLHEINYHIQKVNNEKTEYCEKINTINWGNISNDTIHGQSIIIKYKTDETLTSNDINKIFITVRKKVQKINNSLGANYLTPGIKI